MRYFFLLFPMHIVFAQALHHQTFSSQGKSTLTSSGYVVSQSVGQQSVPGVFSKPKTVVVQQGFQQLLNFGWDGVIVNDIRRVKIYPNPFTTILNFEFINDINEEVEISLFDIVGKLVFKIKQRPINNILTIESVGYIAKGDYVISIVTSNFKYSAKIIKD